MHLVACGLNNVPVEDKKYQKLVCSLRTNGKCSQKMEEADQFEKKPRISREILPNYVIYCIEKHALHPGMPCWGPAHTALALLELARTHAQQAPS